MVRVRSGDEHALAALVRRYESPLYNYARKYLGRAEDAEEVFQETFLRVYRHRGRFKEGRPFRPWLYRIATNLCRDRLRYRGRRPEVSMSALRTADDMSTQPFEERLVSQEARPDNAAVSQERAVYMQHALMALNAKHRAVFLMAHQEGMPYAEIAAALRIPVGTVKSRMNKAVAQLTAAMEAMEV